MSRRQRIILAFLNAAAFLITILVNYFASSTLSINGQTTGAVSQKFSNLFVPASFTFSIWGIIYLAIAVYVVYQLIESFKIYQNKKDFIDAIGFWFIVASLMNCSWVFAWHYEVLWLSIIFMLALLGSLSIIYVRLKIGNPETPTIERYFIHLAFNLYLGWVCVATIANVAAWIVSLGWDGGAYAQIWTVGVILLATVLGLCFLGWRKDIIVASVVCWAFIGIFVRRLLDETEVNDLAIEIALPVCFLILLAAIVQVGYFKRDLPFGLFAKSETQVS